MLSFCDEAWSTEMRLCWRRQRLAAVLEEHGAHGCPAQPTFEVDTTFTGVFPSLVMKCVACQSLQVVV